uniref:Uncharacterized mitochondrial protein AtMg00810-like n=1 Tax=Tanacetum cinerariifolium TaxID=118510 RepID=A0A6L2N1D5_TANCI|nr:uncharacterized mitochondrial protein AtMg00810-like [Tanacetum cinerariifolium]
MFDLSEFEELNGGYVAFGGNPKGGKIYGKGKIKTCKLDFDDVYFVKELKFNLFNVSQICDKKNSVLFTDTECLVLSPDFKLPDESQVLLKVPRENNMYNFNLKNLVPSGDLTCLFAKATIDKSNLWNIRLGHINFKTINKLVKGNLVRRLPTKVFENENTCVACKKGKQHRASCKTKPAEAVNTACYVQNRVLVTKPHKKSLYELLHGRQPSIGFMRPFGCPVTILNTLDSLGKFKGKVDEGFLHDFDAKKPKSEVILSPSSSAQSRKQDDKTKKEAKGKSHAESFTGYRDLSAEFKDCSDNSSNEVNVAGTIVPIGGQNSSNSTNSFSAAELEDITYSDDENNVGAEADFNNLETSITFSPIPIIRIHKDHPVSQIVGDLSSTTQTRRGTQEADERQVPDELYGELTFFLGLQVKKKKDGIIISQDKYVAEILKKFGLTEGKSSSTPSDTEKPLLKDPDGEDVDVHTYRSMIGSLMYLTSSRPDIMFAVCACAHFQVTLKASHLHAVKKIFYLKGKPHLGMWYPKDSPFDLVAYLDSDYAGASLDRKSITRGCQFLGCRLIFWQCKKQTVVATSSTEAEYVATSSCYAQFWNTIAIRQVNDVTRLQALVNKKKVVVTEAAIRESISAKRTSWNEFSSAMASAVICLSTGRKFNFSKYIFDSLVRNVDSTSKFYMYSHFLQLLIRKQVGNLSTHTTKYTSPALTQKVFANMRRLEKGFSGVEAPLFERMLVGQEIQEEGDEEEHVEDVTAGDATQRDDTAAHLEVSTVSQEPSILSLTPPTPLPQSPQDLSSTSHVQHTPPQSPQAQPQTQPQPQPPADFPMSLLQEALDACASLTRRVEYLEYEKVAQALEITKLKRRRIDTSDDTVMDDESNQGRIIDEMDKDDTVALMNDKEEDKKDKEDKIVKVVKNDQVQGRQAESQAEFYKIDMDHASKVLSMQEDEPAEVQEVVDVVTTAKLIKKVVTTASEIVTAGSVIISVAEPQVPAAKITATPAKVVAAPRRRRKGVVIKDPKEESTTSSIIHVEIKSKDKGKGILVEEPKPLKKKQQIETDEEYARKLHAELNKDIDWDVAINHVKLKAKEDLTVKRYQAIKREPQTEAQAQKNMMMYLKNVAGFRLDYFKGMSYDDIRLIFEAKFNSNVDFLLKTKE